jgi:hypothetical protein
MGNKELDINVVVPREERLNKVMLDFIFHISAIDAKYTPENWRDAIDDIEGVVDEAKAMYAGMVGDAPAAKFPSSVKYSNGVVYEKQNSNTKEWEVTKFLDVCHGSHYTLMEAIECSELLATKVKVVPEGALEGRISLVVIRQLLEQVEIRQVEFSK